METEGDCVIVRRADGKFDLFGVDEFGKRVSVSDAQFPLPYQDARNNLGGNQLWIWQAATHRIDLSDRTLADLAGCANQVLALLQRNQNNKDLLAVLDDLLGAIYELISSVELGFKGKSGQSNLKHSIDRAQELANGEVRIDGNWMAGFHFNSAMFRISALFDRLPKALACCHATASAAYHQKTGKAWDKNDAHAIRKQVNTMKHETGGSFGGRKRDADLPAAMSAVKQLLELATTLA
jgi:hypothetical protein